MTLAELTNAAEAMKSRLLSSDPGVEREKLAALKPEENFALVVIGIRRCGKSTLLNQLVRKVGQDFFYLNFDDMRLDGFSTDDYDLLDMAVQKSGCKVLFFDEIQSAPKWELYIRQKLDEQFQVLLTGSNASLLSRELGSKLTGRHLSKELFPFNFREFCLFKKTECSFKAFRKYEELGGFPEFVKSGNTDILQQLANDILYRDIAVRYNIRDVRSLRTLFIYLLSTVGNPVSPSRLTQVAGVKSASTVLDYLSYFVTSYLLYLVPKFAWSVKSQALAPKKIYAVDTAMIRSASRSFSKDSGHILENLVFMELRRITPDIAYYMDENGCECDFVVNAHGEAQSLSCPLLVQVCASLTAENKTREINGLTSAMRFFNTAPGSYEAQGIILTENQEDQIVQDGCRITVQSVWKFLTD